MAKSKVMKKFRLDYGDVALVLICWLVQAREYIDAEDAKIGLSRFGKAGK